MTVNLPDNVSEDEALARIICASSQSKKYEKTHFHLSKEGRYVVHVGVFIDHQDPVTLSVNRINTISQEEAHSLGIRHQLDRQQTSTYHGFAKIRAKLCFDNNCQIEKDDEGGIKPYHANIKYPYGQVKEDKQEIAAELAYHAEFIRHSHEGI